ncbi:ATP-binding protein, partial [Vibrio fortis]
QLNEELQSLHGGLTQSARNLLHIVNDVLDYSKIEAGKLELNPTDIELGKVLARIVRPQSIHAQQKGLAFHYWQDPALAQWLYADDIRLHQILNNFLNNAIKFTEHGTISLHVNVIESTQHQQKISLTVSDTGIGIPKNKQDALFQPFEQVDKTTSRRFGGTGLGLSIATKLIEQMEGILTLDSDEGKGSDFTVTISLPISSTPDDGARYPLALPTLLDEQQQNPSLIANSSSEVYIVGFFLQQEELCRYLKHLDLKPKVLHINQKELLQESVVQNKPKHIFIAMSVWQQLAITDAWIMEHAETTSFTIINQSPMLSPEPLGSSWCLSVNPLLPDNLVHVLTKPVSHDCMPLQKTNEATSRFMQESREQAEKNGRLILVAEDHPINQQVIAKQLANIGVHADIVDNGLLALNALKEKRYGLLLTDCHMPEMDGYTLSANIRQLEAQSDEMHRELLKQMPGLELNELDVSTLCSLGESFTAHRVNCTGADDSHQLNTLADYRLPIVALTANAVQGEDENCYAHGMDDFLVKPVSIKQMILTLEKWLPSLNDISNEGSKEHPEQTASSSQDADDFSALFQDIE